MEGINMYQPKKILDDQIMGSTIRNPPFSPSSGLHSVRTETAGVLPTRRHVDA
jgi:hypothetical protein